MEVNKFDDLGLYQFASEVLRIGNRAVKKAREENKRLGLPNGEITTESPLKD